MNLLSKTGPLKIREDAKRVIVSGLSLAPMYSVKELLELLALGNSNCMQHSTDINAASSPSHAVFQVHVRVTDSKTGSKRMVKLSMIDLAGSERAASSRGSSLRFKEGASINKSLLALGNCINKLADGLKHIPYRDSNLTRILKDSLGGNCQTLMVANVSMSSLSYEDTYNTLKYAGRAKKIRTSLRQNVLKSNLPKEFYIKKVNELTEENDRLKRTNTELELQASKCDTFAANGLEDKTSAGNYSPETNGEQTNLNETKLLSVQEDNISGDSTFVASSASTKSNLVTCVLSRELVGISKNNEKLNSVLLRSTLFTLSKLTKTVVTNLQKENRKIVPNRVHKHAISYDTRDRYSCANLGSRQPVRTLNSNPGGIPLRFNRASSLRSKK
uniref:Kinesin motor domain-containing protein n=1 Tax=Glossina pallidipes TaxID=7398 RepID=A0A1A9ZCB4_GLOPL